MLAALQVDFPAAKNEIEIVLPVCLRQLCRRVRAGQFGLSKREMRTGAQTHDDQQRRNPTLLHTLLCWCSIHG
jgi:hypothetical protein